MALRFDPLEQLTPRQMKIIGLAHAGRTDTEICAVLGISPHTLRWHTQRIRGVLPLFRRVVPVVPLPYTEREQTIALSVADGLTNAEIAAQLGITIQSVSNALNVLYEKTGSRNRLHLARTVLAMMHHFSVSDQVGSWA